MFDRNNRSGSGRSRSFSDHFELTSGSSNSKPRSSSGGRSSGGSSRSSYGGGYSSGGRDSSYGSSYGGNRGGNRSRSRSGGGRSFGLDHSKYIKKSIPVEEVIYETKNQFADFEIEQSLKQIIIDRGYITPTPVQDQSIPVALEGKDVVGLAQTGTGKTAAFLIPLINATLLARKEKVFEQSIIIAPTRELAIQIEEELFNFGSRELRIFSVCCTGGSDIRRQISRLQKPNNFVIGTPGRILDLMNRGILRLDQVSHVVLDEVDRMLDMGFVDDITDILSKVPEKRQSLFFSATMNREVERIMKEFLTDPVRISVVTGNTSDNVNQNIIKLENGENKSDKLHELLLGDDFKRVLIFSQTKIAVDDIHRKLQRKGINVESIHGDRSQMQRQKALDKFKRGDVKALIATDVAARGIDVNDVSHVINYEVPKNYEDYIHRIGRTGRGGKTGHALTFVD